MGNYSSNWYCLMTAPVLEFIDFIVIIIAKGGRFMPNQHTVHNPNGGWDVKGAGNSKATKHFDTQAEAYKYAQNIAKNQHTEALLHGLNGKIRARESYGNDPIPPRDKEH